MAQQESTDTVQSNATEALNLTSLQILPEADNPTLAVIKPSEIPEKIAWFQLFPPQILTFPTSLNRSPRSKEQHASLAELLPASLVEPPLDVINPGTTEKYHC